jgi:hypothetical protein
MILEMVATGVGHSTSNAAEGCEVSFRTFLGAGASMGRSPAPESSRPSGCAKLAIVDFHRSSFTICPIDSTTLHVSVCRVVSCVLCAACVVWCRVVCGVAANLGVVELEEVIVEIAAGVADAPSQVPAQIVTGAQRKQRNLDHHNGKETR